jgi:hypothetical protein
MRATSYDQEQGSLTASTRSAEMNRQPDTNITIRSAHAGEEAALERLAQLDSAKAPVSPVLVAEVDGEVHAALSLADGHVVADPFRPTLHLLELLHTQAATQAQEPQRYEARLMHGLRFARI